MVADIEVAIEEAAQQFFEKAGGLQSMEESRTIMRQRVTDALPKETRVFMATGKLPSAAFPN